MPTYEYECTKCGGVVEIFQSIMEAARKRLRKNDPKPCDCNAPVRRRIGTGGGVIFKGSGFYQTDYRSESYKKAAKAETESGKDKVGGDKGGEKVSTPPKEQGSKGAGPTSAAQAGSAPNSPNP